MRKRLWWLLDQILIVILPWDFAHDVQGNSNWLGRFQDWVMDRSYAAGAYSHGSVD